MKIEKEKIKKIEEVTLSASKINLFYECPRKYLFRYLYQLDKPILSTSWPASGLGDSTHKIIEWANKSLKEGEDQKVIFNNTAIKFQEFYDSWLTKNKKSFKKSKDYNYEKFVKNGQKYSNLVVKFLFNYFDTHTDVLPEHEFEMEYEFVPGVKLKGIIDIIYFFEDKYKIIDFKTTKESEKFYFIDWMLDTQSLIYLYYCLKKYSNLPESFSYLVLNHELKTLFFKETYDFEEKEKKLFRGLTMQVNEVAEYTKCPDLSLANPVATKCRWCEFAEMCDKKYKVNIKSLLGR